MVLDSRSWNRRNPASCMKYSIGFRCKYSRQYNRSKVSMQRQHPRKVSPANAHANVPISNNRTVNNMVVVTPVVSGIRWKGFRVGLRVPKFINAGSDLVNTAERASRILLCSRKCSVDTRWCPKWTRTPHTNMRRCTRVCRVELRHTKHEHHPQEHHFLKSRASSVRHPGGRFSAPSFL